MLFICCLFLLFLPASIEKLPTDSVSANIAERYARYNHLDKVKFYHISREFLSESYPLDGVNAWKKNYYWKCFSYAFGNT